MVPVGNRISIDTKIKKVFFLEETDELLFADYA